MYVCMYHLDIPGLKIWIQNGQIIFDDEDVVKLKNRKELWLTTGNIEENSTSEILRISICVYSIMQYLDCLIIIIAKPR